MDSVEEIETAIDRLPPEEYRRVVEWLHAREQAHWSEQIDRDSSAGKLDFLFAEAESESTRGLLSDWPSRR